METHFSRNLYMRYRSKEGAQHVMEHRVWDADIFVAARQAEAREKGGVAEPISREQYLKERG
jgi:hypothetical protein